MFEGERLPALRSLEIDEPYEVNCRARYRNISNLFDWTSLSTLIVKWTMDVEFFADRAHNLKRLNLFNSCEVFHDTWRMCVNSFPLLEDLRIGRLGKPLRPEPTPPLPPAPNLRSFILEGTNLRNPLHGLSITELSTACPKLDTLGIFIKARAYYADGWIKSILAVFPLLKTLLLFVCDEGKSEPEWGSTDTFSSVSGMARESLDFFHFASRFARAYESLNQKRPYKSGSSVTHACKNLDYIQQHKAGSPLENLMFVPFLLEYRRHRRWYEQTYSLGFDGYPGLHYGVSSDGLLEVTEYTVSGDKVMPLSRKYGNWNPKPRSKPETS